MKCIAAYQLFSIIFLKNTFAFESYVDSSHEVNEMNLQKPYFGGSQQKISVEVIRDLSSNSFMWQLLDKFLCLLGLPSFCAEIEDPETIVDNEYYMMNESIDWSESNDSNQTQIEPYNDDYYNHSLNQTQIEPYYDDYYNYTLSTKKKIDEECETNPELFKCMRFSKVTFPEKFVLPDNFLPLNKNDFPIKKTISEILKESFCPSVVDRDDFEPDPDLPSIRELIRDVAGGPPSHPRCGKHSHFWPELEHVVDVALLRQEDPFRPACEVMELPEIWSGYTLYHAAEAVHDEYPGENQALLLQSLLSNGLTIDSDIIPQYSKTEFVQRVVMLADLNTWSVSAVGIPNFGLKWHVGRARPEEVVYKIKNRFKPKYEYTVCLNQDKNLGTSFSTPEECASAAFHDDDCTGNTIMWSPTLNSYHGCRCCSEVDSNDPDSNWHSHSHWHVYQEDVSDLDDCVPTDLTYKISCLDDLTTPSDFTTYPEGSPAHPSWPAMHSAASSLSLWLPVVANLSDEELRQVKLTDYAVAYGRTIAGVHYETDNIAGLNVGQEIIAHKLPHYLNQKFGVNKRVVEEKIEQYRFDWNDFEQNIGCH